MSRKNILEYLEETVIIEQIASEQFGFVKQAGVSDILGGVADSIKNTVSQQVQGTGPEEIGKGLVRIMAPSILFKLHPIVGVLYLIGNGFGFDIVEIFEKIWSQLKPLLASGKSISSDIVTQLGKNVIQSEAGPLEVGAFNWASMIKEAQMTGDIAKELVGLNSTRSTVPKIPWLSGTGGPLQRIFGQLFQMGRKGKAKWLLGGFIIWIIKTILSGVGLLSGASAIKEILTPNANSPKEQIKSKTEMFVSEPESNQESTTIPAKQITDNASESIILKPSGRGQQYFQNNEQFSWVIPLINSSIEDTLLAWMVDIYPNTQPYKSLISQTSEFQSIVKELEQNWKNVSPSKLVMPNKYHKRKQVVDTFAHTSISGLLT